MGTYLCFLLQNIYGILPIVVPDVSIHSLGELAIRNHVRLLVQVRHAAAHRCLLLCLVQMLASSHIRLLFTSMFENE